jgi:ubiquinone biosynthesis protein COQ9
MIPPPERSPERDAAILAMLPNVAFDGWTRRATRTDDADLLFPLGAADMIEAFCDLADRQMEEAAADLTETRLSRRVRAVIALRLAQNRPHKEAIRRALAVLALPQNTRAAAATTARTVDAIWRAAGDDSSGVSWYTKRAIMTAVYSTTILYWLRDMSEDDADTLAFLDRRLAGVGRIGKLRGRVEGLLARLPRPPGLQMPRGVGDTG